MGEGAAPTERRRGSPVIYPASRLWIAGKQGAGDSSPPPVGWKMAKIILAEDDNDMRRFLVKALQNAGYDVISFDNGLSAYQRLREEPFELLLTDIVMPIPACRPSRTPVKAEIPFRAGQPSST